MSTMTLEQVNTDELREFAARLRFGSLEFRDDRERAADAISGACNVIDAELAKQAAEPVGGEFDMRYDAGFEAGWHKARARFEKPEQAVDYSAGIREAAARLRQACDFARIPCTPSSLSPLCQSAKFLESIVGIIDTNRLFPAEVVDGVGDRLRDAAVLLASFQSGFGSLKTYDGDEAATWDRIDRAIAAIFTTIEYLAGDCQTLDSVLPLPVIKSGGLMGPEYANGWNDCRDEILSNLREKSTPRPAVATPAIDDPTVMIQTKGWRLIPETPTEEILDVLRWHLNEACQGPPFFPRVVFDALLSALPDPNPYQIQAVPVVATPAEVTEDERDIEHEFPVGVRLGLARKFLTTKKRTGTWGWEAAHSQGKAYGYASRWNAIIGAVNAALAAQPSAVGVPEERKASLYPDESREDQAIGAAYDRGWNDCRKAILAAAPETTHD